MEKACGFMILVLLGWEKKLFFKTIMLEQANIDYNTQKCFCLNYFKHLTFPSFTWQEFCLLLFRGVNGQQKGFWGDKSEPDTHKEKKRVCEQGREGKERGGQRDREY